MTPADSQDSVADPLPAPTTVTRRSLQLRRAGQRSTRSSSRSTASSASQSRDVSVVPSLPVTDNNVSLNRPTLNISSTPEVKNEQTSVSRISLKGSETMEDIRDSGSRKRRRVEEMVGSDWYRSHFEGSPNAPLHGDDNASGLSYVDVQDAVSIASMDNTEDDETGFIATIPIDPHRADLVKEEQLSSPAKTGVGPDITSTFQQGQSLSVVEVQNANPARREIFEAKNQAESSTMAQQRSVPIDIDEPSELLSPTQPFPPASILDDSNKREAQPLKPPYATSSVPSSSKQPHARAPEETPLQLDEPLSAYTCPVCFTPPTHATLTPCGHICCGECLFTAVKTTMQRAMHTAPAGERQVARCPVCRAPIPGWDSKGGGIIGLKPKMVYSL